MMLLFCGFYFARFWGDVAVSIYIFANSFMSYYNMGIFYLLLSFPMLGIRGFYPILFPCYNAQNQIECNDLDVHRNGIVSMPLIFVLILIPQFLGGIVLLRDAFQLIQLDAVSEREDLEMSIVQ
jgi:hypothetical protein